MAIRLAFRVSTTHSSVIFLDPRTDQWCSPWWRLAAVEVTEAATNADSRFALGAADRRGGGRWNSRRHAGSNLDAATTPELRGRLDAIRDRVDQVLKESELNAVVHSDLVLLKDLFVRCRNDLVRRESGR